MSYWNAYVSDSNKDMSKDLFILQAKNDFFLKTNKFIVYYNKIYNKYPQQILLHIGSMLQLVKAYAG